MTGKIITLEEYNIEITLEILDPDKMICLQIYHWNNMELDFQGKDDPDCRKACDSVIYLGVKTPMEFYMLSPRIKNKL